jgi:hypothetical protein
MSLSAVDSRVGFNWLSLGNDNVLVSIFNPPTNLYSRFSLPLISIGNRRVVLGFSAQQGNPIPYTPYSSPQAINREVILQDSFVTTSILH